jgi:energy-coupling factor transporter ATP-binding protein EcfA2
MNEHENEIIIVLGKRGHGKTTLVKQIAKRWNRQIIIDALGYEYEDGEIFTDVEEFCEYLLDNKLTQKFTAILRPPIDTNMNIVFLTCQTLDNYILICEESDMYIGTKTMPKSLHWLINYGRHIKSSIVFVARTVPEISIRIRKEYTAFYCFCFTEPSYLQWLRDYGFDDEKISKLSKYEFVFLGENIIPDTLLFQSGKIIEQPTEEMENKNGTH